MSRNDISQLQSSFPKGLAQPAIRALHGAGITHLEQLENWTETELRKLHGMGPRALETLRVALNERGLCFAEEESKEP